MAVARLGLPIVRPGPQLPPHRQFSHSPPECAALVSATPTGHCTWWGAVFSVAALLRHWHPFNVQSVAWVAERKYLLSTFCYLLTLGAYAWYARNPKLKRLAAVVGIFVLALASKPMAVTLPFVLLLLDYWPLQRYREMSGPRVFTAFHSTTAVVAAFGRKNSALCALSSQLCHYGVGSEIGRRSTVFPDILARYARGECTAVLWDLHGKDTLAFRILGVLSASWDFDSSLEARSSPYDFMRR